MKPFGIGLSAVLILLPIIWLPGIGQGRDSLALFSQYLGMAALIAMAISHLIATRWAGIEAIFGPLDQSYRIHKWLGLGAMIAILIHDTIDADMEGLGRGGLLEDAAETAGEISLYGLLIFVAITVATFIPYHLWKWTHRLIGLFFVLGAAHYLFILKPFKNGDPLGLYMAAICLVGILAYIYTSAPRHVRPSLSYRITDVTPEGNAVAVSMAPEGRAMKHLAGQFAFFGFKGAGLGEPHPFTLSSAPRDDGQLRVTIAPLGDLTSRLSRALAAGQSVTVEGAYGHFGRPTKTGQVWIAAGIGITPFLALAQALDPDASPVHLIYAVRDTASAAHLGEIEAIAQAKPNLTLTIWESQSKGRLTADGIAQIAGTGLKTARVMFCGPSVMRRALGDGLRTHGVSPRKFHYEAFEIRTGIGLEQFLNWLWTRGKHAALGRS